MVWRGCKCNPPDTCRQGGTEEDSDGRPTQERVSWWSGPVEDVNDSTPHVVVVVVEDLDGPVFQNGLESVKSITSSDERWWMRGGGSWQGSDGPKPTGL